MTIRGNKLGIDQKKDLAKWKRREQDEVFCL